jgi:N-methylhydantoinase A/oxoprolinase/acetone carboxylase beta subunit
MKKYIIGIDIGGTNTDAVLIDNHKNIIKSLKTSTSSDVISGIIKAVHNVSQDIHTNDIEYVSIGTTLAMNSLLESKNLYNIGIIRLAGYQPDSIMPCFGWPNHIKNIVIGSHTINGGYECDGREISSINEKEIVDAAKDLISKGAEALVINGTFSCIYKEQENKTYKMLKKYFPSIIIGLSSDFSHIGYISRENTTIINTALKKNFAKKLSSLKDALDKTIHHIFIVQNNGTLITIDEAIKFPIKTIAAGPTNSAIGGALLAQHKDAIIVDIGGTSTDIAIISNGIPRKSMQSVSVGGIRIKISSPDMISIALGGGSIIEENDKNYIIGPLSVGYKLFEQGYSFGGNTKILTDAAIALNIFNHPLIQKKAFNEYQAENIFDTVIKKIDDACQKINISQKNIPVILVGGGSQLLPKNKLLLHWIIPEHNEIANAYGAACAKIAGTIERIISSKGQSIDQIIQDVEQEAINIAQKKGAINPIIVEKYILPFPYSKEEQIYILITAAG